jgi:hypothetical protein
MNFTFGEEILYFSITLCVRDFFILFRHHNRIWINHTFVVVYMFRLIKPSSSIWLSYIHLYSSGSIPILASVFRLEYCFSVICNAVIHMTEKGVLTSHIKY